MTTIEETITAAYEGADALGFFLEETFSKSSNEISIKTFKKLVKYIPVFVTPIIITSFSSVEAILSLVEKTRTTVIQINQNLSLNDLKKLKNKKPELKIIKEIKLADNNFSETDLKFAFYIDTFIFNFKGIKNIFIEQIKEIINSVDKPVMLSNINLELLKKIYPYGVVLNDEIVRHDGYKDFMKMRQYITELKGLQTRNYFYSNCKDFFKR